MNQEESRELHRKQVEEMIEKAIKDGDEEMIAAFVEHLALEHHEDWITWLRWAREEDGG